MLLRRIACCCTFPLLFAVALPACAAGSGSDEHAEIAPPPAATPASSVPSVPVSTDAVTAGSEPPSFPRLELDDVKHVVTAAGGTVDATSTPGQGVEVVARFPRV